MQTTIPIQRLPDGKDFLGWSDCVVERSGVVAEAAWVEGWDEDYMQSEKQGCWEAGGGVLEKMCEEIRVDHP